MTGRDGMSDADRDMLNRLLAADESDMTVDDLLRLPAGAVSMFRLLVESQRALGKIHEESLYHGERIKKKKDQVTWLMMKLGKITQIARTARKGGKL